MKIVDEKENEKDLLNKEPIQETKTGINVQSDSGIIMIDIEPFVKWGITKKEITKIKGLSIFMHTLTEEEMDKATDLAKENETAKIVELVKSEKKDLIPGFRYDPEKLKVPVLTYAIDKINELEIKTESDRQNLYKSLRKAQHMLIEVLYIEYNKLVNEQFELFDFEEIKKK